MILAVDRTIVSTIKRQDTNSGWDRLIELGRAIDIWILRIVVSLVLASWIAETYSVFLHKHLIEDHLKQKIDEKITSLELKRLESSNARDGYVKEKLPGCAVLKSQLSKIPIRLERESLKCPSNHKTNGECKGREYDGIKEEEKELNRRIKTECNEASLVIPDYLNTPGERIDDEILKAQAKKNNLQYDISQGADALQAIGVERYRKRHPRPDEATTVDELVTWMTFSPHKTFMVLLIVDLLPLIVKMLVKTAYFPNLEKAEESRNSNMTLVHQLQSPPQNRRKTEWNPIFSSREQGEPERRSALP